MFWLLYFMFVMMAAGGLMATAQLGPIAKDFQVGSVPVSMLGITLPALTFAATIDRVLNGVTRPFFGWVSPTTSAARTRCSSPSASKPVGIYALSIYGQHPLAFVLLTGLVFFAWGEIYSLFPATCADTFGSKYAATNAGLLYTAKGTASLVVPFTSVLTTMTGSWHAVFLTAAAMNAVAALLALFVLKPMRAGYLRALGRTSRRSRRSDPTGGRPVCAARPTFRRRPRRPPCRTPPMPSDDRRRAHRARHPRPRPHRGPRRAHRARRQAGL